MRFLAALLVLAGIGIVFVYPLYQRDFSGTKISQDVVFNRANGGWQNGWKEISIPLLVTQNPLRIRFEGEIAQGEYFMTNTLPLYLELDGPDGTILIETLQINTKENHDASGGNPRKLIVSTPDFTIISSGDYRLKTSLEVNKDVSLKSMDAIFVANIQQPDPELRPIGLGMLGVGALGYLFSRRRRKPEQSKFRWGRQK